MEQHNSDLFDVIAQLVNRDDGEMKKFEAREHAAAGDDLFAQIAYRTRIANFLAQGR
jgi:hypothetical protein